MSSRHRTGGQPRGGIDRWLGRFWPRRCRNGCCSAVGPAADLVTTADGRPGCRRSRWNGACSFFTARPEPDVAGAALARRRKTREESASIGAIRPTEGKIRGGTGDYRVVVGTDVLGEGDPGEFRDNVDRVGRTLITIFTHQAEVVVLE